MEKSPNNGKSVICNIDSETGSVRTQELIGIVTRTVRAFHKQGSGCGMD